MFRISKYLTTLDTEEAKLFHEADQHAVYSIIPIVKPFHLSCSHFHVQLSLFAWACFSLNPLVTTINFNTPEVIKLLCCMHNHVQCSIEIQISFNGYYILSVATCESFQYRSCHKVSSDLYRRAVELWGFSGRPLSHSHSRFFEADIIFDNSFVECFWGRSYEYSFAEDKPFN